MEIDKNYKESDLKKDLDSIKTLLQDLSLGCDLERFKSKIINYYVSPSLRILKVLSYPLMKSLLSTDINSVISTISSDLSSDDVEIQINALKLMYKLDSREFLQIMQSKEKELFNFITNPDFNYERLICLHDILIKNYVKSFSSEDNNEIIEIITVFYLKIAELALGSNRDLTRNCLEVFIAVFENYLNFYCDINIIDYFFDGNGPSKKLLKPLITKIINYFLGKIEIIFSKIITYETRLRSHLISFIVLFLEILNDLIEKSKSFSKNFQSIFDKRTIYLALDGGGPPTNLSEFIENILKTHLFENIMKGTYEIDLLLNTNINIFRILNIICEDNSLCHMKYHIKCEFVYEMFLYFIKVIPQLQYKRELNVIALNIASFSKDLNITYSLNISLKILEITMNNIQNLMTRIILLMIVFDNLLDVSFRLCKLKKKSSLYCLFQQPWFLKKIKENDNTNAIREEIVISMIIMTLNHIQNYQITNENKEIFSSLLTEVFDIAYTLIDWNYKYESKTDYRAQNLLFAIDVYLILLKKSLEIYSISKFHNQIFEIVKRLESNEMIFAAKLKAIHLLSNYLENETYKDHIQFNTLMQEFKNALILPIQNCPFSEKYLNLLTNQSSLLSYLTDMEQIFVCLYIFAKKLATTENDLLTLVVSFFTDFTNYLNDIHKLKGMHIPMIDSIKETSENVLKMILNEEEIELESIKISREWFESINIDKAPIVKQNNEPRDVINIAYNIFEMTILSNRKVFLNEYIESDKPIKNLKNAFLGINNEEISNYRFKKSKIITGYADFLQIYVSHAFFVANSLISLNLSIFNIANFALNNIKINIIFNESAEIFPSDSNPRTIIIDELQGNKQKNIFFTLKINSIDIIHIYFEIKIDEDEMYKFRSLPYKIGLCNLILPNKIIQLSQEFFFENWYNIRFQMQFKCHLIKSVKEIIKIFEKKNFSTCFLNFDSKNENENKNNEKVCISLGLLGISWDGYVIAGKLSQIFMNKNSQICFFELKTNKLRLIERIKSEIEYFLEDLSDENLNLII